MVAKVAFVPRLYGPEPFIINGGGGGYTPVSSEAIAWVARALAADAAYNTAHHDADALCIDTIMAADANIWPLIDVLHVPLQQSSAIALLNWKSSSFSATLSGTPPFTADLGFTGGSSRKFNTNFNASTAGGNYKISPVSLTFIVQSLNDWTSGQDSGSLAGYTTNASSSVFTYPHYSDNNFYQGLQYSGSSNIAAHIASTHWYGFTYTATTPLMWRNTTSSTPANAGTDTLINDTFNFLGDNAAGYRPYSGSFSCGLVAGFFTSTQMGIFQSAFNTRADTLHGSH